MQKNKKVYLFLIFQNIFLVYIQNSLRFRINEHKILLRINTEIELVAIESAETLISRKLFATNDYIGYILHKWAYYKEDEDKILYFEFTKDMFLCVFSLNILMKIFKEIYEWYLSFKQYANEVKQARNRLRRI